jgi:hypothetical protein
MVVPVFTNFSALCRMPENKGRIRQNRLDRLCLAKPLRIGIGAVKLVTGLVQLELAGLRRL